MSAINYTNLENYCSACRNTEGDDYGTIQSYCSEGFTMNTKRNSKIVVNPQTTLVPEFYKVVVNPKADTSKLPVPGKPMSGLKKSSLVGKKNTSKILVSSVGLL